ncbi:hypothetical protein GP486_005209 [Trichoglossum hirsutum]|uniref:AAA+ ATPase domain-containing protein n=1 Tax=Trichoglossum hirsutum TaxID=265104 RepID=A0A9P8RMP9_9PEZI|nr:hypothetical protein GP486_005209 [Trichoglossum hirsutum]
MPNASNSASSSSPDMDSTEISSGSSRLSHGVDKSHNIPDPAPVTAGYTGSKCDAKHLYNHSVAGRSNWSEFEDPVKAESRLVELSKPYAIVHRCSRGANGQWGTKSLEVQNPQLRSVLDDVFKDYQNWYPDCEPYAFSPPFKPLIHRWEKILESRDQQRDEAAKGYTTLFITELKPQLEPYFSVLERIKRTGVISFGHIWYIFAPGDLVITRKEGILSAAKLRALKLVEEHGMNSYWKFTIDQLDWNGSNCGFASTSAYILEFVEPRSVTKLDILPFNMDPHREGIQKQLLARGQKFAALRGCHVKTCIGTKYVVRGTKEKEIRETVSGRVVIDAYAFYKCQNKEVPKLSQNAAGGSPAKTINKSAEASGGHDPGEKERHEELHPLTDIECITAVSRVKGFDLKSKEWCEFNVDDIQEPEWNDSAYDNLVLPQREKDLIIAFADRTRRNKRAFDDFIKHKGQAALAFNHPNLHSKLTNIGQGIIILLYGPPGVGKTLTAESVAEKSRSPLYVLSAGDLGTDAEKVEAGLNRALECCHLWNALLLLDEADVLLETRGSDSLDRNELVSIFLRRLEHYRGLMFLTTNRIRAIDPAFKSRIDITLPYNDLDESARRQVWANFIGCLAPGTHAITDGDINKLAECPLNGREIKNSIKIAQVLASNDERLSMGHLETVVGIRKRFLVLESE